MTKYEQIRTVFLKAVASGICIAIGGTVYMACANKYLGAFLFAVGLITICAFGFNLYTGKIGYIINNRNRPDCIVIWFGNLVGTVISGILIRIAKPSLVDTGAAMLESKFSLSPIKVLILGLFCGILMYIAVDNWKNSDNNVSKVVGIFVCVPVFIIAGFEHSIADMFYCAVGVRTMGDIGHATLFLLLVTLGNTAGALIFRFFAVGVDLMNKKKE